METKLIGYEKDFITANADSICIQLRYGSIKEIAMP
jgi:hypothetical protein